MDKTEIRRRLLAEHNATTTGIWRIYGEDNNCDLGGPRLIPTLDTVSGAYEDVVEYALDLPNFISWGRGGHIEKIEYHSVDKVWMKRKKELLKRKADLEAEIADINRKIQRK